MKIDLTSIIYLFGGIQAFLLLIGINIYKPLDSDLKKIASVLLLAIMIVLIYYVILLNHIKVVYPYIDSLGTAAWMAIAPSFYLFVICIQEPKWSLKWKHLSYFLVSLIFLFEEIVTTLGIPLYLYLAINNAALFLDIWMVIFFGTGIYFMTKSAMLFHNPKENPKNLELLWFSYLLLGVYVIFSILYLFIRKEYAIWFELILIILLVAFVLTLLLKTFSNTPFRQLFNFIKYDNKNLSEEQLKKFAYRLEKVMEDEKPYLDKKLSLNELSNLCDINKNDLSQLFNSFYNANFYEFVNNYRLEYLEKIILDPQYEQYKIIVLAEESGFNSKATFYKVFKEKHQLTPSQYIKKYRSN